MYIFFAGICTIAWRERRRMLRQQGSGLFIALLSEADEQRHSQNSTMEDVNPTELLRHFEKESEVLTESHQSVSNELLRLQVEEEMLMRTFHNLLSAQGLIKRRESMEPPTHHNQLPERFVAASPGDGNYAARKGQLDTRCDEASMALVTVPHQVEDGAAGISQAETNRKLGCSQSFVASQEDGNWAAERSKSQINHVQQ